MDWTQDKWPRFIHQKLKHVYESEKRPKRKMETELTARDGETGTARAMLWLGSGLPPKGLCVGRLILSVIVSRSSGMNVVARTFNPSTQEAEASRSQ